MLVTISPTKLETYRKHHREEMNGWITKKRLIEQLTAEFKPSPATSLGKAYHELIEFGPDKYFHRRQRCWKVYEKEMKIMHVFNVNQARPALNTWAEFKGGVNEVKVTMLTEIPGYTVYSSMRVDQLYGLQVNDWKTTSGSWPPKYNEYERSVQWRMYLMSMPEMARFLYRVFQFGQDKDGKKKWVDQYDFMMERRSDIDQYVKLYMNGYIEFCLANGLDKVIRPDWVLEMEKRI